jgi:hypothetical protein
VAVLFTSLALAVAMGPRQAAWAAAALALLVVWVGVRKLGYWEVTEFQKSFLSRLVAGLRASWDATLVGAEHDIARAGSIEAGWERLCETAWELGMTELRLAPVPAYKADCPEFHSFAPVPEGPPAPSRHPGPFEATWSIAVDWRGEVVAEVTARRPLGRLEFDPARFAAVVQHLVRRHLDSTQGATSRQEGRVAT